MNASFERFKDYLIPLLCIGVVIILIPLVIMPQLQQIAASSKVISSNKNRLSAIEQKAGDLEELNKSKAEIQSKLNIAESALPINKNIAQLVLGVQQIAINSGLKVTTLKIQPGKTATASASPKSNSVPAPATPVNNTAPNQIIAAKENMLFEINLTGSLVSFEGFLKSLETAKRVLTLSEFKTVSATSGADFNFDVFISAPFGQLPKLSSDQIAEALPKLSESNTKLLNSLQSESFKDVTSSPITPGPTGVPNPFQ